MYRIATNVRAFGRQTTWHPLFSIFGWFLPPFFLYVIPLLVLREQWKASDPAADDGTESWKRSPDNPLLWGWFVFYGLLPFVFFVAQIGSLAEPVSAPATSRASPNRSTTSARWRSCPRCRSSARRSAGCCSSAN
jgi:hypothetical protein